MTTIDWDNAPSHAANNVMRMCERTAGCALPATHTCTCRDVDPTDRTPRTWTPSGVIPAYPVVNILKG